MWSRWIVKEIESELEITSRDLDYLQFIFDCGVTRTSAVHAYFNPTKTKQVTYRRLEQFASRPYTFLVKPRQQRRRENATVTTSYGHMLDMLKKMRRIDEKTRAIMAFQCEPTFDPLTPTEYEKCEPCKKCKQRGRVPKSFDDRCFTRPYERSGLSPITLENINGKEATAAA